MNALGSKRFPVVTETPPARVWLKIQSDMGLASNTVAAYARGLEEFLCFCCDFDTEPVVATRADIASYVRYLSSRPRNREGRGEGLGSGAGLSNATIQQRLTAVRLFYDYLVEEQLRDYNPVGRGRYTPGNSFGGERGLVRRYQKLPWVPSDEQWTAMISEVRQESLRNRLMLALAYDSALRREELCSLTTGDIDPSGRLIRIRAETTKGRAERVVPYSESTGDLYRAYLSQRRNLSRSPGLLFLSESRRNRGQPVSIWTWSKVVRALAKRSGVEGFSTHTPRHLCLTDLARTGWDIHEIAGFAGHKNPDTTMRYIHLSGRDLASKLEQGMAQIHSLRAQSIAGDHPGQ